VTPAAITVADARPLRLGGVGASTAASIAAGVTVLVCVVARLPDRLLQVTGLRGWAAALVGVIALVNGARTLAQAPFTYAQRQVSPRRWAVNQLTVLVSTIAVGAALTLPLYALIRASSAWWLWAWGLFALVTVAGQLAMPLIVRVQSGPLQAAPAPLAARARAVARRAGVDLGGGVLLATKPTGPGRSGPRCNAYLVGLGATRRVVLEPGLAAWPPQLIDQVLAHEIGHWRLGHTARRLPITIAGQLATFALAAAVLSFSPLLTGAGVTGAGDPRSYPLLLALTAVVVLPARLMLAWFDRAQERAADRFALTVLAAPVDFAAMLDRAAHEGGAARRLPWWRKVAATHPPIGDRVLACRRPAPAI
jgi:STE24 endopeptidase